MILSAIIITLLLSAFFSGAEIAFITANKLGIEVERNKGTRVGRLIAEFFKRPALFFSTLLVGNNLVLVLFTSLMDQYLSPSISTFADNNLSLLGGSLATTFIVTIISTLIVLFFGEFMPKVFFRIFADNIISYIAYPIQFFSYLLRPITFFFIKVSNFFVKMFLKEGEQDEDNMFSRMDLENFIQSSQSGNEVGIIDTEMFGNALYLKQVRVKECMVPRTEIIGIDVDASAQDLRDLFVQSQLSRILVYDKDIDEVLGYVYHQQMLYNPQKIKDIIMEIPVVPSTMQVNDMMNIFIGQHVNIACVVDEFGGTAGIITLEDILEEIFGEIHDEHDQEEYIETKISDDEYIFSGRLELDYLNQKYELLDLPDDSEYHTLSGYLISKMETIPQQGDEITLNNFRYIIELVSDKKIESIRVLKTDSEMSTVMEEAKD